MDDCNMDDALVFEMQRLYPQIYLACHVDHVRPASTGFELSSHDSAILAHLDFETPVSPGALAEHLAVVPSTLSASLSRLERLGYITNTPCAEDRRRRAVRLSQLGAQAMASTSVLDADRVRELLAQLSPEERAAAITGLSLLATAARRSRGDSQ
jgi:DNA-binding MarR family transcriptional regulator